MKTQTPAKGRAPAVHSEDRTPPPSTARAPTATHSPLAKARELKLVAPAP